MKGRAHATIQLLLAVLEERRVVVQSDLSPAAGQALVPAEAETGGVKRGWSSSRCWDVSPSSHLRRKGT